MKPRLLCVEADPVDFAPLIEAAAAAGLRCGWLDLEAAEAPPPALEAAARLGVLRAVAAVGERVVSVKPVRGGFVERDLLREHFSGCALVLTRGPLAAPSLRPAGDGEGWVVTGASGEAQHLSTEQLTRRLRRPAWWKALR